MPFRFINQFRLDSKILLEGIDLREYNLNDLHREMGVIFQDFMRYEMTTSENIAVGCVEEINKLEPLWVAKQSAGVAKASG